MFCLIPSLWSEGKTSIVMIYSQAVAWPVLLTIKLLKQIILLLWRNFDVNFVNVQFTSGTDCTIVTVCFNLSFQFLSSAAKPTTNFDYSFFCDLRWIVCFKSNIPFAIVKLCEHRVAQSRKVTTPYNETLRCIKWSFWPLQ